MRRVAASTVTLLTAALLFFVAGSLALGQSQDQGGGAPPPPPQQPIAFSHKVHVGTAKLPCKMCHPNPDPGDNETIVAASVCMQCHSAVAKDNPEVQKLAQYAKSNTPIPWAPVYELPSFVIFSHRVHTDKGNTCQECHGNVAARDALFRETNMSMAGCVACHTAKKATVECNVCHELQQ